MSSSVTPSGKLTLITGCMFSGKTETLITHAKKYLLVKKRIALIKYSKDTRYSVDDVCSHSGISLKATFSGCLLSTFDVSNFDVILVDEIQFFSDADTVCNDWANSGKIVIVAGLNGTYQRKEFPVISKLIPCVEEFINLKSICSNCGDDAFFTTRTTSASLTSVEFIGGSESYQPRCRKCFS